MRLDRFRASGFTLVELLITVTLAGFLIVLAIPNFVLFFANANIRTAAESINNGVKLAQAEAIKLNAPVQFVLDSPTTPTKYTILDSNNAQLQQNVFAEGSAAATFTVTPALATRMTFSGLGQMQSTNAFDPVTPGSAPITRIDVSAPYTGSGSVRKLAVVADVTKGIKLCDPKFTVPDPKACP